MKASSCIVGDREAAVGCCSFEQTARQDKERKNAPATVELLQMRRTKDSTAATIQFSGSQCQKHDIGKGMSRHTGHHRIMEPGRALVMMVLEAGI